MIVDVNNFSEEEVESKAKEEVQTVLNENMEFMMNTYVIPEMKRVAFAANLPKPFADNIKFVQTDEDAGKIVNTWGSDELPLAIWFNYGTKDHGSLGTWPLHWKDKVTGKDIYAMWVRGVPRTLAMEIGWELGKKRLKQEGPKFIEERLIE